MNVIARAEIIPADGGFIIRDQETGTHVFLSTPLEAPLEYIIGTAKNAFATLVENAS